MQNPVVKIKKSHLFGLLALLLWTPLPWLYFDPPRFLQGQPLAVYAVVLFLSGISSAALAIFFVLKSRISLAAARTVSLLILLAGIGAYQFSGFAPNWSCFGKQVYVATVNAAGQNCTTTCTDNDVKPCSGWSTCWDKFVSCNAAGKDQDGRPCLGCCFSCQVVCEPDPDQPPAITSSISCSQAGDNGWCRGTGVLTLTASDPQNYPLTISGDIGGTPFTCAAGDACFQPLPQGSGAINYTVTAASGMSASGSTTWKLDATPPSVNGTLSGALGSNGWYLGPVTYNGSASDALSGLAGLTCTLDGSPLGSCTPITVTGEGAHTLVITARDLAGNVQTFNQNIPLDIQNPNLTANISGTLGSNNWYTSAVLNASASDPAPGSGLSALEYSLDNGAWTAFPAPGTLDLVTGVHNIDIRAVDKAGRVVTSSRSYSLDGALPNITLSPSGTIGSNNWYTTDFTLAASASDDISGLDIFEYSLNNGAWTTYSAPLTLANGTHTISFWAQDKAGLVRQIDGTYKVDTRAPQITGSVSGVPGMNGWYISDVTIGASAADPVPGSGLEALNYILNGGAQTTYTAPLTLSNGQHTIQFDAQDLAGLTDTMTQTVKVDTLAPSLNITTTLPSWSKGAITLNGTAGDGGSGLSKVEISTNGGSTWQTVNGTTAWNYIWNTSTNGVHQVRVRSTDNAGLATEHTLNAGVDNSAPKISLPASWLQWDTVTLDAWDNDSGLSDVRVEISDPEGRWKTRKIDLDPDNFPLDFKWDRRFGDDTVAPLGTYDVKVIATDKMGNRTQANATINILLGILPPGPAATPQPYVRVDSTPTPASSPAPFVTPTASLAPVTSIFGSTPDPSLALAPGNDQTQGSPAAQIESIPGTIATPRAAPTQTTFMDWLESIFVPNTPEETVTDVSTPEADSNMHWDATLAAMAAAVTAYTLAEKRKREEEEAPLTKFQQKLRAEKTHDMKTQEALMREIAQFNAEQERLEAEKQREQNERMEAKMARVDMEDDAKWVASQVVIQKRAEEEKKTEEVQAGLAAYYSAMRQGEQEAQTAYEMYVIRQEVEDSKKSNELQAGMAAYYSAMRQGEQEAQTNWWEKTKSFVNGKIIQPVNESIYQPVIKPALQGATEAAAAVITRLNEDIYQPVIKPKIEERVDALKSRVAWVDENIYQPHIKPKMDKRVEELKSKVEWVNENIYQPHIKPGVEATINTVKAEISVFNETVYQPHIKPAIEGTINVAKSTLSFLNETLVQPVLSTLNEHVYKPLVKPLVEAASSGISWINRNIYQPIFQPVVSDINKYIYQPFKDEAQKFWDEYGEWVHGCLDTVGFIPGLGEIADGLNGLIYLGEGRYIEASVSLLAMVPLLGDLGKAGKWTVKAGQEILEEAVEKVAKEAAEELVEKAAKETATEVVEEVAEKTIKETGEELAEKVAKDSVELVAEEAAEKAVVEAAQELAEKATKETAEALSSKALTESVENTATKVIKEKTIGNVVKGTAEDASAKAVKNITEAEALAGTKKLSQEAKEALVKQLLEKVDDRTAALVRSVSENLGDNVVSINTSFDLVQKYGDDAVKALRIVEPDAAAKVLRTVDKKLFDDVVQQGSDAFAAFSGWSEKELKEHGKDLAARAAKDAEVLNDVKTLVSKGPIDPKNLTAEQKLLIEKIAANSTFFVDGKQVVVGKWAGLDDGFLQLARETGSLHYSPHPDLWKLFDKLENQNEAAWLINEQVIQTGIAKGLPFEYTLDGIPAKDIVNERAAIKAIFSGQTEEIIKKKLRSDYLPVRLRELQELKNAGFDLTFDEINNSYILMKP